MKSLFNVNGKPFFSVGGQVGNSVSTDPALMEKTYAVSAALGLNTIAAPVHWALFEPQEGSYDFAQTAMLIDGARRHGLKLVLLWFGSWKNGNSHYAPVWMKRDKVRFPLALSADGTEIRSFTPLGKETHRADKRAFAALCRYIAQNNADGTVIGVQVENEPGLMGAPRDHSPAADALFAAPVPPEVAAFAGKEGTWEDVFGVDGAEFFSAYHFATYIDAVAEAGKRELALPMYVNVWLGEMYAHIPGVSYPAGGAVCRTFRFWKHLVRHIDAISPDVYLADYATSDLVYSTYSSEGNVLYLPESMPHPLVMLNSMRAVAEYNLTGIHLFGIDILTSMPGTQGGGAASPQMQQLQKMVGELTGCFKILLASRHLIETYQGTGRLFAVTQFEGQANQVIDFGDYLGEVEFLNQENLFNTVAGPQIMDNRHLPQMYEGWRAKGFVVYAGEGEFFLTGDAYRLKLRPKFSIGELTGAVHTGDFLNTRSQGYLTVTEGRFDEDGQYHATATRMGDEYDYGLWVTNDIGVVHVLMDR